MKTLSKHTFLGEEGRNTTPLKSTPWTAEVIFTAEVRPKCYKVSQSRWKRKKRGLEMLLTLLKG